MHKSVAINGLYMSHASHIHKMDMVELVTHYYGVQCFAEGDGKIKYNPSPMLMTIIAYLVCPAMRDFVHMVWCLSLRSYLWLIYNVFRRGLICGLGKALS